MPGVTLDNLTITETFYGWFNKTNEIISTLNSTVGSGISGAGLSGDNLIITLVDGTTLDSGSVIGPQGIGVSSGAVIDDKLIITLSNGNTFDVGNVRGPQGATGFQGNIGITGSQGNTGVQGLGVPEGGLVGFSLVKKDNTDYSTEWKDLTLQVKGTPGNIGGWESKKVENIVGEGPLTSGRNRFPRWSPNLYMSDVHIGPGVSMDGSTGFFMSAGFLGNSSGYDDGVTAGYKVLNFFENLTRFEGNTYYYKKGHPGPTDCGGLTLDSPPGFYWNRMKYFPVTKLTPIYVSHYTTVDQFVIYVAGYRDGATANNVDNKKKRRGTFGFFGMAPINTFPSGTPYSTHRDFNGFVNGSTCSYYFRPTSAAAAGTTMALAVSDSKFDITGVVDASYTGDYVKEVKAGRTGPIGLYSSSAGPHGVSGGFTLEPGWYYIVSEFIPAAWFSVGTSVDVTAATGAGAFNNGINSDGVILTHTDAVAHHGYPGYFGMNGFELAPAGENVGDGNIPEPFAPSCYMGIPSIKNVGTDIRSLLHPTGLPPHLWYSNGFTGATSNAKQIGRFITGATSEHFSIQLGPHIGLHSYDVSSSGAEITEEAAIAVRSQNSQQASAPRIALSTVSTSNALESLTTFEPGVREVDPPGCAYDCFDYQSSVWTEDGGTLGFQRAIGTPCAELQECQIWCCPGTTFANHQFDSNTYPNNGGDYANADSQGRPGAFIPCITGTDCGYPSCGSTTGYLCGGCITAPGSSGDFGFPTVNSDGSYGQLRCKTTGLFALNPDFNNGACADSGLSADADEESRTISLFVNNGEGHHIKWFGAGTGVTGSNHLIWHTSTYGCTTGITFNRYEGP